MTFAYIPSPPVSSFSIGSFPIHYYALTMIVAIVAAAWLGGARWKRLGGNYDQILDIAICAVPAGIIGARLYHVITTPERFFGSHGRWVDIFNLRQGGLGIWGAVLLGGLAAWAWCRHKHYPAALLCDAMAPALLVAQAIGRIGNWFNQELYGAPTDLPWGLKLNDAGTAMGSQEQCYDGATCPTGTLFHPTFLYEMIWDLIGAALLVWIGRQWSARLKAGSLFTIYVMWYTAGRTWIEALRIDFAHMILGLRVNVWVSIVVFIMGAVAFAMVNRRGKPVALLSEKLRTVTEMEERRLVSRPS
ncbi:prolipoprotein diacylglyceryl transferase [Bifidobacterium xylocopae]|uniref:Phosphatidylglycerol--prolipoprotein diacylglyceryl transferase n=1 Tax=Bifidobacterium xylocopae TaxID=2493119 RepID=A0A366KF78_9BIFI|nr:prolipoprotein diacylglyceryl transferase [Bifidobacterium xylocopae]RBP99331.1 prolipoprotein diacylglyceryl transferase [Bifidobacterium xylocopae]